MVAFPPALHVVNPTRDRALGCFLGALTEGSGIMLSLAKALGKTDEHQSFPKDQVAAEYRSWLQSQPSKVDTASRAAIALSLPNDTQSMMTIAAQFSMLDKSNGALSRSPAIPIWGWNVSDSARADSRLTHPNPACQVANATYCVALAHLIRHPGDGVGAISRAAKECRDHVEVDGWLQLALNSQRIPRSDRRQPSFVKWAFIYAFNHLQRRSSFEDAHEEFCVEEGDAHVNSCSTKAALGALWGAQAMPPHLLNCQPATLQVFEKLWRASNPH